METKGTDDAVSLSNKLAVCPPFDPMLCSTLYEIIHNLQQNGGRMSKY